MKTKLFPFFSALGIFFLSAAGPSQKAWADLPGVIKTIAGKGTDGFSGDGGQAINASLSFPRGLIVDDRGNVFFADSSNDRVRRIDGQTSIITTFAGAEPPATFADGGLATETRINSPHDVFFDLQGNILIAENGGHRIRRVDKNTGIITTIAGTGRSGFSGDGGPATEAKLYGPTDLFVDKTGNIFISEDTNQRIRRIDAVTGIITTVAGNGSSGFSGDGVLATQTSLNRPYGVFVDDSGNIFIADTYNYRIRRVDAVTGIITTVAGTGSWFGGINEGGLAINASINEPEDIFLDKRNNLIFTDTRNCTVRRVDAVTGLVTTIAGTGYKGFGGDGLPATIADLNVPRKVFIDAQENYYIGDTVNHRIRFITALLPPKILSISPNSGPVTGGTLVTINGENFQTGATVKIGEVEELSVGFHDSTRLSFMTPPGSLGLKDIVVINGDTQTGTLPNGFTYVPLPTPTLTSVSPNIGITNGYTRIAITGTNLTQGTTVKIGDVDVIDLVFVDNKNLTALTPPNSAGTKDVIITIPDGQTATLAEGFTYAFPIKLTSIAPDFGSAAGGTPITLIGENFAPGITVKINGVNTTSVVLIDKNKLTAITPAGTAGAKDLVVTNPDGQTTTLINGFTYVGPPTALAISPVMGPLVGGTKITINGSNFLPGATIKIGGVNATSVDLIDSTQISGITPAGTAGWKNVVVTNPDGQNATLINAFRYNAPPTILSYNPHSGPAAGGTVITITGNNFTPATYVKIDQANPASIEFISDTKITATTLPNASGAAVDIEVINIDGQSFLIRDGFTYEPPLPVLLTYNINYGPVSGGTFLTFTRSIDFPPGTLVKIDGITAPVVFSNGNQLQVVTPPNTPGDKDIVLNFPDGSVSLFEKGFTYRAGPGSFTLQPNSGLTSGNILVAIEGSHFEPDASVQIGGVNAVSVAYQNSTRLMVVLPAHSLGPKDVVVTNPDGQKMTMTDAFTYVTVSDNPEDSANASELLPAINIFNPNNGEAGEVAYRLDRSEHVQIYIYDRFGVEVLKLVDEVRSTGPYLDSWEGRNSSGDKVAAGYYNVLLKIGSSTRKLKLVVMK